MIDLLNAVLAATLEEPIASVEILNPFTDKTSIDDKLSILDVKARDGSGRLFNVEMQMRVNSAHAVQCAALYYWAGVYREQLGEGEDYIDLEADDCDSFRQPDALSGNRGLPSRLSVAVAAAFAGDFLPAHSVPSH